MTAQEYELHRLRLRNTNMVVLAGTPAALFGPWVLGAPMDLGLLVIVLIVALWKPSALLRALRSSAFHVIAGLALLALLESGRLNAAADLYAFKFILGTFTGIALHFACIQHTPYPGSLQRRMTLCLAAYITAVSYFSLITGAGYTQIAGLCMIVGLLVVFHALPAAGRALCMVIAVPAILLLNAKAPLFAFLTGCLVLANLRRRGEQLQFRWFRAAAATAALVPMALGLLWLTHPDRFDDLVHPRRSHSTMARLDMAAAGVAAFRDNPVLGLGGYGMNIDYNFSRYYEDRNLAPLIARGQTRSHGDLYGAGFTSGVHNVFLDYLTTYGGLSFVVLIVLLARGLIVATREAHPVKIAAVITILVLGQAWQYTASAFGTAFLVFGCWPFRFTATRAGRRSRTAPVHPDVVS